RAPPHPASCMSWSGTICRKRKRSRLNRSRRLQRPDRPRSGRSGATIDPRRPRPCGDRGRSEGTAVRAPTCIAERLTMSNAPLPEATLNRLARTLLQGPDAIIYAGSDGAIRFWNEGAERLFGFTEAEAL